MTLSKTVKDYGFKSIAEVERLGDVKRRTLYNWQKENPRRLRVYLLGCWLTKCGSIKGE